MAEKPNTVTVEVLQAHTAFGKAYDVGDTYEIDEAFADSVCAQGKAKRTDAPKAAPDKPSQPVEPLTTDDFPKSEKTAVKKK